MAQGALKGYKGRGVVLHTLKYGESSMVVHLLTDVAGRQSFIVQGVRSSRGRGSKVALFQPLFGVEFEGLSSHRGELHRFAEVRSGIVLRRIPFDIRRSTISLFIAEVLYRLVKESGEHIELFNFVWGSIEALDTIEDGVSNFHLWFLANLSRQLGFMPSGEYHAGMYFDIVEGQFCRGVALHGAVMQPREAQLLYELIECDVMQLAEIELNRERRVAFLEAILQYYGYHLDAIYSVQSIKILQELF